MFQKHNAFRKRFLNQYFQPKNAIELGHFFVIFHAWPNLNSKFMPELLERGISPIIGGTIKGRECSKQSYPSSISIGHFYDSQLKSGLRLYRHDFRNLERAIGKASDHHDNVVYHLRKINGKARFCSHKHQIAKLSHGPLPTIAK